MIFAGFMETFDRIEKKLEELSIPYHILKGQSSTVKKYIDDFKEKKVRILMLNAQYFGAGMNLQMASDIIMYHRFRKEMEEQIIGRAQRLGRSIDKPLNVYYLLHENENNDIEDNFHFEDKSTMHYMDWLEQEEKAKEEQEQKKLKISEINKIHGNNMQFESNDNFIPGNNNIVSNKNNTSMSQNINNPIILNNFNINDTMNKKILVKENIVSMNYELDIESIINNIIKENNLEENKLEEIKNNTVVVDFKNEINIDIDIDEFEIIR
jgi:hypothetical protein